MTEIYCKCGPQMLEDTTCAECGETLRLRWIPASERLPELPDWVTCLTDRNEVFPATYVDGKWFDDVQDKIGRYQHVTHWMPLPPPPEDE